jgi:arylsulfatase A-like enzyme
MNSLSRREFVSTVGAAAGTTLLSGCLSTQQSKTIATADHRRPRPNVLLILTDQHRFDALGCAGNADVRTPNIDRLAGEGVRYENAFCPYPICTPSRYSIFSGLYVHQHRGTGNDSTLNPSIPTWPKALRAAGYRTAAVGKMHMLPTYLDIGFDEMVLSEQAGDGRWDDDYHRYLMEHNLADITDMEDQLREYNDCMRPEYVRSKGCLPCNIDEPHDHTTWIGDHACRKIAAWPHDAPNLLCVSFIRPHHPMNPPQPWADMYDPRRLQLLPGYTESPLERNRAYHRGWRMQAAGGLSEADIRLATARYYGSISQIDAQIGRLIAALQARGLYENTLIAFTADHGEYMGFQHLIGKLNYMYDPLVKVPLILRWPGANLPGQVRSRQVSLLDLAPTICAAAGLAMPSPMPGMDLHQPDAGHDRIFCQFHEDTVMVRTADCKLVLTRKSGCESLLFDLQRDPHESRNRIGDPGCADEIKMLEGAIEEWRPDGWGLHKHVDPAAPQVDQPNVPRDLESHRRRMKEYFGRKMAEAGFPRLWAS